MKKKERVVKLLSTQDSKMQVVTCKRNFWTSAFISYRTQAGPCGCHQLGTQCPKPLITFENLIIYFSASL